MLDPPLLINRLVSASSTSFIQQLCIMFHCNKLSYGNRDLSVRQCHATSSSTARCFSVHSLLDFVVSAYVLNFSRRTDNNGKSSQTICKSQQHITTLQRVQNKTENLHSNYNLSFISTCICKPEQWHSNSVGRVYKVI